MCVFHLLSRRRAHGWQAGHPPLCVPLIATAIDPLTMECDSDTEGDPPPSSALHTQTVDSVRTQHAMGLGCDFKVDFCNFIINFQFFRQHNLLNLINESISIGHGQPVKNN